MFQKKTICYAFMLSIVSLVLPFNNRAQNKTAAAPALVKTASIEGVEEYKLPNGMKVLLIPDATQNNVVVNIVYNVGSRHEGYGETGMAHLLEHMLFKGSKKFSSIKKTIADKGASANGTTYYDRTNYYEILPASDSNLRWALDMESDRMVNSLMLKADLQKEFSVVRNEFESGENNPGSILMERIVSTMYLWHNYGKSTIGSKEDIERVPIENLTTFYKKYYQPDNATLIVGGKFDVATSLKWITEYFAKIPKPTRIIQPGYTIEPQQDGERFVELKRNGDIQYLGAAYHTPCLSDKDYVANDVVIEILTNDPSGILYKALIETKLATKVYGYSLPFYDPGFTYFNVDVPKDKSINDAKKVFLAAFDSLATTTITKEQLDRAKNTINKYMSDMQNNTINYCINLTEFIGGGNWKLFYIYRDRLEKISLADVQAVAKRYYLSSNRTWGQFIPDKNPERVAVNDRPDISELVKDYKGKKTEQQTETFETSIDNIKKSTITGKLSNGLKYALLKKGTKGDKITISFILKMGTESTLMNKDLIAELTAKMLKYGTTTRSKKDINDQLDKLKSSININGGATGVSISISSDKENLQQTLAILEDLLLHPAFDKNEFEKMILDVKGEYEANRSEPFFVAQKALEVKTNKYPKGHPLASESIEETLDALGKVKPEELQSFYTSFYGTNNASFTCVGSFEPNTVKTYLEKAFNNFISKTPYERLSEKFFDIQGSTEVVTIKDKQNAVCLGNINIAIKDTDEDYAALNMANELLGGGAFLSSRIPQRLRESEGMSYGAGSYLNVPYKDAVGAWGVYAIFNPSFKNKLDSALRQEIEKALQAGFTQDELSKTVNSWLQQRKTSLGMDNGIASLLNRSLVNDRDISYYTALENKTKALKLAEVNAALKKFVSLNKLVIIYAGDFNGK